LIRFEINLESDSIHEWSRPHGPLFHRWLPDGQREAIQLNTGHPSATIRVWFERFGFVNTRPEWREIVFDRSQHAVDPAVMDKQGILSAGPLMGELRLEKYGKDEIQAVTQAQLDAPAYIALAKQVLNTFILPTASKFIRVLQLDFGQYWLCPPQPWDSQIISLGSYCRALRMAWSIDEGKTWAQFQPTNQGVFKVTVHLHDEFDRYIRESDWKGLADLANTAPTDSLTLRLLLSSRERLDTYNDIRFALVESVTAVEVCIAEMRQQAMATSIKFIQATFPSWGAMNDREKFALLALVAGNIPHERVELACAAWGYRNKVVHEGWSPNAKQAADIKKTLESLILVLGSLLSHREVRVVTAFPGNAWMIPDQWEAKYESSR
jgi:hypothetical protein